MAMEVGDSVCGKNKLRVLFAAISYEPITIPSDKQFLNELVKHLPEFIVPAIWSLTESVPNTKLMQIGDRRVRVTSRNRLGHRPSYRSGDPYRPHPTHNSLRQLLEISSSLLFESTRSLRGAVYEHHAQVIHFVDNVGPIIKILKACFPGIYITCGKPGTRVKEASGRWLYKILLRKTYDAADKVVTFTDTSRNVIIDARIPANKVLAIPWGIKIPAPVSRCVIEAIRRRHGCTEDSLLVVVLPRGPERFITDMITLAETLAEELPIQFVFAIKPTRYSTDYDILGDANVTVENGPADFHDLLAAADVAFAPQERQCATILPPLAWLEAMARGTPVITMTNPGIGECITDGETGLLYQHSNQIKGLLERFYDRSFRHMVSSNAQSLVSQRFNIHTIAGRYASLWESLAECANENDSSVEVTLP